MRPRLRPQAATCEPIVATIANDRNGQFDTRRPSLKTKTAPVRRPSLAELVAVVIVIVISMLDDHNFPVVVMAVPIMVVIAVGLDDDRIFGAGRSDR
jgi:hypothetical protein